MYDKILVMLRNHAGPMSSIPDKKKIRRLVSRNLYLFPMVQCMTQSVLQTRVRIITVYTATIPFLDIVNAHFSLHFHNVKIVVTHMMQGIIGCILFC
jgi:hypothetical protein